jgi:hypothetical protein
MYIVIFEKHANFKYLNSLHVDANVLNFYPGSATNRDRTVG